MVRTRFASLALASSMLFSSGCFCWGSGTCFPRLRAAFCGTNTCCSGSGSMGAPVMSGYEGIGGGYAPGAVMSMQGGGGPDCNCQHGATSFHPAIMAPSVPSTPTIVPTPAPAAAGPVVPTEGAIFPGTNAPIMMNPTVAPPVITPTPGVPNRLTPTPATPSPTAPPSSTKHAPEQMIPSPPDHGRGDFFVWDIAFSCFTRLEIGTPDLAIEA
ncbi:MAG: hypothetical protein U0744_18865 [Gemmataceae bacterium]